MPKRSRSLKSRILNQTPPSSIDIFDSKVLFNDQNNRFQYYQRVFTHQSVNKYLIIKNINPNIPANLNNHLFFQSSNMHPSTHLAHLAPPVAVSDIWCSQHNNNTQFNNIGILG